MTSVVRNAKAKELNKVMQLAEETNTVMCSHSLTFYKSMYKNNMRFTNLFGDERSSSLIKPENIFILFVHLFYIAVADFLLLYFTATLFLKTNLSLLESVDVLTINLILKQIVSLYILLVVHFLRR